MRCLQEFEARRDGHARRRRPRAGHHAPVGLRHEDDVAADGGHPHLVPVQGPGIRGAWVCVGENGCILSPERCSTLVLSPNPHGRNIIIHQLQYLQYGGNYLHTPIFKLKSRSLGFHKIFFWKTQTPYAFVCLFSNGRSIRADLP